MNKKQRLLKEFEWQNEFDEYTFDMEKHELIKWWRKDYIAIKRVRELHKPFSKTEIICDCCACIYPCPTIQALDGEQ